MLVAEEDTDEDIVSELDVDAEDEADDDAVVLTELVTDVL